MDWPLVRLEADGTHVWHVHRRTRLALRAPVHRPYPQAGRDIQDLAVPAGADGADQGAELVIESDIGLAVVEIGKQEEVAVPGSGREAGASDEAVQVGLERDVE